MADFDPPFASSGERRLPTTTEQANGIPCGPLDRTLFNGIFHLLNGNIGRVIQEAGITGPDGDLTKLFRAIQTLIASATGSDPSDPLDTSQFVTFPQARARLPIYPEVITSDGRMGIFSPGTGQVRIPGGVTFLHRGIWLVTTTQTDIATDASKTYHLRWNPTDGIVLRDLASGTYNPGTLPESDPTFDSTYDDMLIARVVTNSSNVPTITNLANRARLSYRSYTGRLTSGIVVTGSTIGAYGRETATRAGNSFTYNWSRAPELDSINAVLGAMIPGNWGLDGVANVIHNKVATRYATVFDLTTDLSLGATTAGSQVYAEIDFRAVA